MSRIGKLPIPVPKGVEVAVREGAVEVKGPKGHMTLVLHPLVTVAVESDHVALTRVDDSRTARAQHGLRRTLLNNAVEGVSKGFSKTLEVIGTGYKVSVAGGRIELALGFSHPVRMEVPKGLTATAEGPKLTLSSYDKELLGEFAAQIRRLRPPEPYKGKGVKYVDEVIRRKAGKSGGKK